MNTAGQLRERWLTPEGAALRDAAIGWLVSGGHKPSGLGTVDGRVDFRGEARDLRHGRRCRSEADRHDVGVPNRLVLAMSASGTGPVADFVGLGRRYPATRSALVDLSGRIVPGRGLLWS